MSSLRGMSKAVDHGFRREPHDEVPASSIPFVFSVFLGVLSLVVYCRNWVPLPLGVSAPPELFSEGRALKHALHLSQDIGNRQVGTPNADVAATYVLEEVRRLAVLAEGHPNLIAEVDREQVTGGVNAQFAGVRIASAYNNLTNIILYIAPKQQPAATSTPALLLNSHFDSIFGTKGASDCGSCVGVMLEIARTLLADPATILAAPLLFLFNGGEETLLLAAHGFTAHSKWAARVGAFINLESTGPGGPGYLFQHTAGWTVAAYAKAAKYPQGSVCGQDFFDSRLLKMDTDFRMFSSQHHGSYPGIDIAYIMDGAAYHTNQDTVERIRKGTVQASGENILAAALEISRILASPQGPPASDQNAVFFDILGTYMVTYSWATGAAFHTLPFVLVTGTALFPHATTGLQPAAVFKSVGLVVASLLSAVFTAALAGVGRTLLTGKSLVWFGKPLLFGAIYGPAAFAGLLLPYVFLKKPDSLRNSLLGLAAVHSCIAAALTAAKARSGFMSAGWAVTSNLASSVALTQGSPTPRRLLAMLVLSIPASILTGPLATNLPVFVMEHISIAGAPPPPFGYLAGDAAVGVIVGLAAFFAASFYSHLIAYTSRANVRRVVAMLLAVSALSAVYASLFEHAYSKDYPKRVLLQHYHLLDAAGKVAESRWSVAGMDAVPIKVVLQNRSGVRDPGPTEWQGMFPLSSLLRGESLPAEGPDTSLGTQPAVLIRLVEKASSPTGQRLHLELQTSRPSWGTFNMSGGLLAWSFAEDLQASSTTPDGVATYMVRYAGNNARWSFWVDMQEGSSLRITAAVLFMESTPAIERFVAKLPDWTNAMPFTAFHASFVFS